ncbi:MAG: NUDIX hydrolase [Sphingobacteriales bacterium]|nr:MAG: NUDIX hydrolase [Sphingobacteriales bacterium]
MIDENVNPFKKTREEVVYDNNWISVNIADIITPKNTTGIYGTVHFKNYAIGIIPIDEEGNTYLVGQYRYALDAYSWEIPEGGGPLQNDILLSAKKELQEEVGFFANKWTKIAELNTSNSVTDEVGIIFVAQGLEKTTISPDDTEELQIKKMHITEAIEWAMNGKIKDAIAIIGLLKLKILIDNKTFEI